MAMSYVTRKAPCSLLIYLPRVLITTRSSILISDHHHSFLSHHFSSLTPADAKKLSDQKFANLLNSEIEYFNRNIPTKPIDFPFKEDRQYWDRFSRNDIPGEDIDIQVIRNSPLGTFHWSLQDFEISVTIYKKGGTSITLQLIATADDEIIVKKLMIDLPGESRTSSFPRHTSKLEKIPTDIQHCLKKFLEMRGINRWNIEFLCRYYLRCDERDDMKWLTTLKNFVMESCMINSFIPCN